MLLSLHLPGTARQHFCPWSQKTLLRRLKPERYLKGVAEIAGGRGGGKPEMAEGGTKDIAKLDKALEAVYDIIKKDSE